MAKLLTSAQMRAAEAEAFASGAATGLVLMERAGQGVVDALTVRWPAFAHASKRRALVLCGPGNNGGDGFVVARLLAQSGWQVDLWLSCDPAALRGDAHAQYEAWAGLGVTRRLDVPGSLDVGDVRPDLIVDALFGTGLTRPIQGAIAQALHTLQDWTRSQAQPVPVVAVDLPSGLCSDSGRILGTALPSALTVTFHIAKCGHYLAEGPEYSGHVEVVDIGLPQPAVHAGKDVVWHITSVDASRLTKGQGHKFDHGHAVVLSGGVGRGGAARLAARGALRIGAGLVTVGCPPAALIENAARLDAVMLRPINGPEALAELLTDSRLTSLCIGPGFSTGPKQAELLATALRVSDQKVRLCLDADALTLVSQLSDLRDGLHDGCVITPHMGEFTRLFPQLAERLKAAPTIGPAYSKVEAVRAAASEIGCTVLLKGPDTVIAGPDGRCGVHSASYDRSAPWLATAGSGDVLAGFVTGLLARGLPVEEAAETGAFLHTECARHFGPGLIAEDLADQLPVVLRGLGPALL